VLNKCHSSAEAWCTVLEYQGFGTSNWQSKTPKKFSENMLFVSYTETSQTSLNKHETVAIHFEAMYEMFSIR